MRLPFTKSAGSALLCALLALALSSPAVAQRQTERSRQKATAEKHALYERYLRGWHGRDDGDDLDGFVSFLYDSPVDSVEFEYRDPAGRLLAVGICDVCDVSLSSVYFYFDPAESRRGLGTFGAIREIAFAREAGIPYYYLGYWIEPCRSMRYKSEVRPFELLNPDGQWRSGE